MIPEISSPDISLLASLVCRTTRLCESVTNLSSLHSQCCYCKRWTAQCWFIFIKFCQTKESEIPSTLQFYKHSVCHIFGEGSDTLLQYSCLENPMDGGAWWATVHGVAKSRTRLSDFTFPFHFHALEKEMASHSSTLTRRIPGTGEPGGLPSMGSHRVGHDWSDLAAAAAACHILNFWNIDQTISCQKSFQKVQFHKHDKTTPCIYTSLCKCSNRDGFSIALKYQWFDFLASSSKVFLQPQVQARPSQML